MPRNGSGSYSLVAGNPVVTGTIISSTWANTTLSDIATALTNSIAKDGQTTPTANLPMGGYKVTGLGNASATGDAIHYGQIGTIVAASGANGDITSFSALESINGGQLAGFRNKIINGAFQINRRGYVSGSATTAGQYTFDRWKVTGTGGITFSTVNNKTTVTIPAGQTLQQVIEGLNLQTGTYVLSWEGTARGRIAGGTYGASGEVTASITGGVDTTIEFNAGTVTNLQIEIGTQATSFENRYIGFELAMCQRYFNSLAFASTGWAVSATKAWAAVNYSAMRTQPTAALVSGSVIYGPGGSSSMTMDSPVFNGTTSFYSGFNIAGGLTTNAAVMVVGLVLLSSEL